MKPQTTTISMKRFFQTEYKKGRLIAFSSSVAAAKQGVPTLSTISQVAVSLSLTVKHFGYGCFGALDAQGREWFSFFGGGTMIQAPDNVLEDPEAEAQRAATYTPVHLTLNGPKVKRAFRDICPEAFQKEGATT